jgi:hypothetical protein
MNNKAINIDIRFGVRQIDVNSGPDHDVTALVRAISRHPTARAKIKGAAVDRIGRYQAPLVVEVATHNSADVFWWAEDYLRNALRVTLTARFRFAKQEYAS